MSAGQQQSRTGRTGGATPTQRAQTDWTSVADAAASTPNPMYVTRADAAYDADAAKKTKCRSLRKKLLQVTGLLFGLLVAILMPYFAVKVSTLSNDLAKLSVRVLKLSEGLLTLSDKVGERDGMKVSLLLWEIF
ncbi:PREDICTED: uncharacterized protein LOC109466354 [Branchiostoma belcheri]|uniref:Uncharacterized protein LOC109466354 n=1 Tax=Branchiostoma belcheri TaxID=7741 RepID=A0A6P4YBK3_BRABE|nr:PREDICTED: uncharacterized protein LOC109466354 [Branchiostoma belcheri]